MMVNEMLTRIAMSKEITNPYMGKSMLTCDVLKN
jgi:hypothetical protein